MSNLFDLKNKVIIVTGASRGIGLVLATELAKLGANVYGLARAPQGLDFNFNYRSCDLTDDKKTKEVFESIIKETCYCDVLVNCAGATYPTKNASLEARLSSFQKTFAINLYSPYLLTELASEVMIRQKNGSIINVTSIAAEFGFPDNPAYVASKGGLKQMTKAFAMDLGPHNVRVNNLCPGYIHTDMTGKSFIDKDAHQLRLRNMILPRWGTPQDLVGACIFLASDASRYVTGADIVVDGGWSAKGLC